MNWLPRTLAGFAVMTVVALGLVPTAQAAPITLQLNVNIDRLCFSDAECHDISLDETMTYTFDDAVVSAYGYDLDSISIYRSDFGSVSMTMDGPLVQPLDVLGTLTSETSSSFLYRNEGRQPVGSSYASLYASDTKVYGSTGMRQIQLLRSRSSDTGGDGQIGWLTAADFVNELSLGSFIFTWNEQVNADRRSFYATGTATLAAVPDVPEPTSLLLLGTGLLATVWRRRRLQS
jgi:hypothetical protein